MQSLNFFRLIVFVLALSFVTVTTALTGNAQENDSSGILIDTTFISFNGKFYFKFPSRWIRVDYKTADFYLQQSGQAPEYEAIFAPATSSPFFIYDYLVLQVDTIGNMTDPLIDTVLAELQTEIGTTIRRVPRVANIETELTLGTALYDESAKTFWGLTDVVDRDNVRKLTLIAEKYYERGIARFSFFAPDTSYTSLLPLFRQVIATFGSENYQTKSPVLEVAVADSTKFKKDQKNGIKPIFIVFGCIVAVLTAIVLSRIRRKK